MNTQAPKLAIHYFDIPGGRGEPARLALHLADIEFDDQRIPLPQWSQKRESYPLKQCPVLEVNGHAITQSNAINRFVGKLAGLYPEDAYQALLCDEIMDAMEDLTVKVTGTFFINDPEELKQKRAELVSGPITKYLSLIHISEPTRPY